jgi:hypothetical protein
MGSKALFASEIGVPRALMYRLTFAVKVVRPFPFSTPPRRRTLRQRGGGLRGKLRIRSCSKGKGTRFVLNSGHRRREFKRVLYAILPFQFPYLQATFVGGENVSRSAVFTMPSVPRAENLMEAWCSGAVTRRSQSAKAALGSMFDSFHSLIRGIGD